jgi:hypothetical protein
MPHDMDGGLQETRLDLTKEVTMTAEPIEVNVYETKTHMSKLLAQVEEGLS